MNEVRHGPSSQQVVDNVKRLREGRGWSLPRLSQELTKVGRPILPTGLHRLENGKRRVDADDLVALAVALDVSPITLLMPFRATGTVQVTEDVDADALVGWDWMRGIRPLDLPAEREEAMIRAVAFQGRALPMGARSLATQWNALYDRMEPRTGERPATVDDPLDCGDRAVPHPVGCPPLRKFAVR
jgi:transcriptional regulator with XRE-family HTH domain